MRKKIDEIKIRISHIDKVKFAEIANEKGFTTSELLRQFIEKEIR